MFTGRETTHTVPPTSGTLPNTSRLRITSCPPDHGRHDEGPFSGQKLAPKSHRCTRIRVVESGVLVIDFLSKRNGSALAEWNS